MIYRNKRIYWYLIPITIIVLIDEWLKKIGLNELPDEGSLVDPSIFEFAIHKNFGIAFDIPLRMEITILISIVIGLALFHMAIKHLEKHPDIAFSCFMIIIGALGNIYDRLAYGFTVDYVLILGRSAINMSDLVILFGVVLLLLSSSKVKGGKHESH